MARAMGTDADGKEPRRGERTLSRGFTHRRARRAFLRPYGAWSFYILLVTFMGISPGGARESSPWREPWDWSFYIFHQICFDSITPAGEPPTPLCVCLY